MAITLFISDLHLSDSTTATESALIALLEDYSELDALYILGDFFEYWVGDDDDSAQIRRVCQTLTVQAERGTDIYLMRGNRDFALGEAFAQRAKATYWPMMSTSSTSMEPQPPYSTVTLVHR